MKQIFRRSVAIYQQNGLTDLLRAARRFVVYGSLRDELISYLPATKRALRWYVRCGRAVFPSQFTDADPFKILWIDPDEIVLNIPKNSIPMRFGRVYAGDWDQNRSQFTERSVYQAMEAHFRDGVPWDETDYYKRKRERLESGKSTRGCTSVDDLPQYFARFDKIYNSLQTEGYKTQRELINESPTETIEQNLDAPIPELNEIGVCIGRDGELIRGYRGEHRLAIAKILGIDRVPVQVLVRHSEWQRIRDCFRSNGQPSISTSITDWNSSSELHPDLLDIQCKKQQDH